MCRGFFLDLVDFSRMWWIFRGFFKDFVEFSWVFHGFGGFFPYLVDFSWIVVNFRRFLMDLSNSRRFLRGFGGIFVDFLWI